MLNLPDLVEQVPLSERDQPIVEQGARWSPGSIVDLIKAMSRMFHPPVIWKGTSRRDSHMWFVERILRIAFGAYQRSIPRSGTNKYRKIQQLRFRHQLRRQDDQRQKIRGDARLVRSEVPNRAA